MYVKTENELVKQISKHVNHVRTQALEAIVASAGISPLRVPMLEVEFDENGFTLEVEVLEKLPPSCMIHKVMLRLDLYAYFLVSFEMSGVSRPTRKDTDTPATEQEDCATRALNEQQ